jgi:putative ABC transport system permease protein
VQDAAPASVYWPTFGGNMLPPAPAAATRNLTFTLRSARVGSEGFLRQVEQAVWSVNANLSVAAVQSMAELQARSMARTSFTLVMLAIAGGMALMLGVIGIYGVLAYTVAQRRSEVGIRMAVGAHPRAVKRMFVQEGLALTGVGVAAGLVIASGVCRFLAALLFRVKPSDPATYAVTALILVASAAMASYLPARRAAQVDPAEALRAE